MNVSEISKNALFVSLLSLGAAQAFSAQDAERIPREMNQISENIAAEELKKTRAELSVAAAQSASAKISVELALVGAESLEALERELTELSRAETLSEEEAARAKELLATRKSIESIKAAAASARKALREKVQLMQAEIAGEEKLSEIKEELLRAELREQFLAAGVSLAQVDASVQKYIDLEKQLSEKRAKKAKDESEEKIRASREEVEEDLRILRAEAAGNHALAQRLELAREERKKVEELQKNGFSLQEATTRAREQLRLEYEKKAAEAMREEEAELQILRAKANGNDSNAERLAYEQTVRQKTEELQRKGVPRGKAENLARERANLEYAIRKREEAEQRRNAGGYRGR